MPEGAAPHAGVVGPDERSGVPVDAPQRVRGRRLRRLTRVARWTVLVLLTFALTLSGLTLGAVRRSFPEYAGELSLPGLGAPVTVYRDDYGVPQVYASSAADLFMAQGYVTAQDRFWEMDYHRRFTAGRLGELFGAVAVPTDAFVRTLGWRRVAEQEWQLASSQARDHLRAYADGVNAWIEANGGRTASASKSLEYAVVGLRNRGYVVEPWDPVDSLAWLKAMAWTLLGNMNAEIDRSLLLAHGLSRDEVEQLYPPYPYARHHPVVPAGSLARATPGAGAGAAQSPSPVEVPGEVWHDAAPALHALDETLRALAIRPAEDPAGIGSNAWVVGGSHTVSGRPLLANDPHLSASLPGTWYQVGLHCTCAYDVQGFSLAGVPGVVIGRNEHLAWGVTNLGADASDLYLEKIEDGRYFDGAAWRELQTRQEVITVAGGSPVTITVRATPRGPLLSDRRADMLGVAAQPPVDAAGSPAPRAGPQPAPTLDTGAAGVPAAAASLPYAVALAWTAFEPGRTMEALLAINQAANWAEFRAAAALLDDPAQNLLYADADGHIGYQATGRVPVRGKGDGRWPVPGWDPGYGWQGYVPFDELPSALDPPGGVIVSANQPVTGPGYAHALTADWAYGYRSQRISELVAERAAAGKLGVADMRALQLDDRNNFAPVLVAALLDVPLPPHDGPLTAARDLLAGWDFRQPADEPARSSAAAAFYNATWRHLLTRTFDELPAQRGPSGGERWSEIVRSLLASPTSPWWNDRSTPETESRDDILLAAMQDAARELTERLGPDPADWRWGDLHTLVLQGHGPGRSGIAPLEWLFNRGPVPTAGGSDAVNATSWSPPRYEATFVPSMRMIVDLAEPDASRWVQLAGTSGHAFHANVADQLELWRTGADTPMRWTRGSIEEGAVHVLTLEPARGR